MFDNIDINEITIPLLNTPTTLTSTTVTPPPPPPTQNPQKQLTNVFIEPTFKKSAFKFDFTLQSVTPIYNESLLQQPPLDSTYDFQAINADLERIATSLLHYWTSVGPVILPKSIIQEDSSSFLIKNRDLFIIPSVNELDEISVEGSTGKRKKLNKEQLSLVRKEGSFDVASLHFANKHHRWKLAR